MPESEHRSVSISDVAPNPFRRLDLYPLDESKIAKLVLSIDRTDFWDNVVARKSNGHFQIAYGHHRMEAVKRKLGKNAKVSLIVRDLDDETMLKMMAADNDDAYNLTPAFILETVAAAASFIGKQNSAAAGDVTRRHEPILAPRVSSFLAWPQERVKYALAQLNAIEEGELSKKAVESLPTIHAATTLHRQVKKAKASGRPRFCVAVQADAKHDERHETHDKNRRDYRTKYEHKDSLFLGWKNASWPTQTDAGARVFRGWKFRIAVAG